MGELGSHDINLPFGWFSMLILIEIIHVRFFLTGIVLLWAWKFRDFVLNLKNLCNTHHES